MMQNQIKNTNPLLNPNPLILTLLFSALLFHCCTIAALHCTVLYCYIAVCAADDDPGDGGKEKCISNHFPFLFPSTTLLLYFCIYILYATYYIHAATSTSTAL